MQTKPTGFGLEDRTFLSKELFSDGIAYNKSALTGH